MKAIDLNGSWRMRQADTAAWLDAQIPGSVAATLLAHNKIEDPNYRDNEAKVLPVFEKDYEFARSFDVDAGVTARDRVLLCCNGLDTIATVTLNGRLVAQTDNMHRRYAFDVKDLLRPGQNEISVCFRSPVKYLEEHPSVTGKKFSTIRKAACMFGWDWGLDLPDAGIWRDIYIETHDAASIDYVGVRQQHRDDGVRLEVAVHADVWGDGVLAEVALLGPEAREIAVLSKDAKDETGFVFEVPSPQLWWPAGFGGQPLYTVQTRLVQADAVLDEETRKIGLRTIVLDRSKRKGGSNYGFVVNGVPVFFRGENLVIEDAVLARTDAARWDRLIRNCLRANLNGIRVWGGAYYPPDYFYELCDRHGLLVYQDFMFACTFYATSDAFVDNVRAEAADNLKRIAHHASLALLCGNNEIDCIYTVVNSKEPETVALRRLFGSKDRLKPLIRIIVWKMYKKLFLDVIPAACRQYAPDTSYVHSSPSTTRPGKAKSFFEYLSDGDMHYYLQYNGNAPYQKLRQFRCRFMTEMGFQSYPSMKTIEAFTEEKDRGPYTDVMYAHQKCANGNETIELYMERDYIVPKDFADYVYLSQLQAGEIMKYSVEHFRRDSAYCRGMVMWQLNDCWPVVSWSGIDYFGRWKAQQYYTKRFYEPVLVSALDEGDRVGLWVGNDGAAAFEGTLYWTLCGDDAVLAQGSRAVAAPSGSSKEYVALDCAAQLAERGRARCYLHYELKSADAPVGQGAVLFALAKDFDFRDPGLRLAVGETDTAYTVTVTAAQFAKGVALDTRAGDCIFSDNFFDLPANGSYTVTVDKADADGIATRAELEKQLTVNCLNDVMARGRA